MGVYSDTVEVRVSSHESVESLMLCISCCLWHRPSLPVTAVSAFKWPNSGNLQIDGCGLVMDADLSVVVQGIENYLSALRVCVTWRFSADGPTLIQDLSSVPSNSYLSETLWLMLMSGLNGTDC